MFYWLLTLLGYIWRIFHHGSAYGRVVRTVNWFLIWRIPPSLLTNSMSVQCFDTVGCVNKIFAPSILNLGSPTWRHGSTSVQPVDVFWSYRVTVSARTYGRRAFAVAGPSALEAYAAMRYRNPRLTLTLTLTAWNSFPDNLRDPCLTTDNFKRLLKTFLFSAHQSN